MHIKSCQNLRQNTGYQQGLALVIFLLFISMLSGCTSTGPDINYDNEMDFSEIHTFAITSSESTTAQALVLHVEERIAQELIAKKLLRVTQGIAEEKGNNEHAKGADIEVSFTVSTLTKEDGTTLSVGLGTGSYSRSGGISLGSIFSIPVGEQVSLHQTLQIDISKDNRIIYSASGSAEIDSKDSISIQQTLDKLVVSLLARFPPS